MRIILLSALLPGFGAIRIPNGLRSSKKAGIQPDDAAVEPGTVVVQDVFDDEYDEDAAFFEQLEYDSDFILGRSSNFIQGSVTTESGAGGGARFIPVETDHVSLSETAFVQPKMKPVSPDSDLSIQERFARAAQRAIEDFEGQFVQTEEQQTGNGLPKEWDVPLGKKKAEF